MYILGVLLFVMKDGTQAGAKAFNPCLGTNY
jgi:hypothetical protein